ncbi:MAG TPA: hypothetical protein VJ914_08730 [Pseudonocardiaceae bacterium]|nr:hypothetical protein [Pseudonocardiaceae bacterium]
MDIWILGATGRTGRAIAAKLTAQGLTPAAVDRGLRGATAIAAEITRHRPAVVINTIGDYGATAQAIARAGFPGGHYVDLAADLIAIPRLLALHEDAVAAGSTLITGAGFGVLATEAVVAALCEGRPTPREVRVDALASVAMTDGILGTALAASMIDVLITGGRRYANDRLVKTRLGAGTRRITLPDGESVTSTPMPSGELLAAHAASGAPFVTATSSFGSITPAMRAMRLPLTIPALRRAAIARLARTPGKAAPQPRSHSWGHAIVDWPDGTRREGWLRAGEGMDYTAAVVAEVAARLARGEGKPGAYTPAAAFGPDLATVDDAEFILN